MAIKETEKKSYVFCVTDYDIRYYGMECAVMINELWKEYWKMLKEEDDPWISLSISDLKFMFPYWSAKTSQHILQTLVDKRVLREKAGNIRRQRLFAFVSKKNLE